jgi:hypothetical protein
MAAIKVAAQTVAYVGFVLGIWLVATDAQCVEVQYNPRVEVGASYDDNANLSGVSADEVKTGGEDIDARLEIHWIEPTSDWRLMPVVDGANYPGHTDLDSNGELLYFYGEEHGPRYEAGIYSYASSQSLLRNYLPTAVLGAGLGQTEPGTTLGVLSATRQDLEYVNPSWSLQLTPRRKLELNASFTDATYNRQIEGGYTNYTDATGSAALVLDATQTGAVTLRALGEQFKPEVGAETNVYGFETEWDGHFSATKLYYLRLGVERSDFSAISTTLPNAPDSTTVSGGLGTHWTYQVTELFADLTRNVAPTAQGYVVKQTQLRLRLSHRVTERLAAFVGARGIIQDPFRDVIATQRYAFVTGGFEWRVLRQCSVVGAYDLTGAKYVGPSALSNSVHISFIYEPNRLAEGPAITVGY